MKTVTAAIIIEDDRVLLTRRGPDEKLAGYWEFPGGKVEDGESLEECLKREIHEELGLYTDIGDVLAQSEYRYDHGSFRLVAMQTNILSGEIRLNVHDLVEWVPIQELLTFNLAPADIPIAHKLIADCTKMG